MKKNRIRTPRFTQPKKHRLFAFFIQAPIVIGLAIMLMAAYTVVPQAGDSEGNTPLPSDADARREASTPVTIGLHKQLMVDDHVIAEMKGVRFEQGKVTKANGGEPIITNDTPWEDANVWIVGSVFRENGKFRMWYRARGHGQDLPMLYCYAESIDGLHWTKPNLGLVEFNGSKDNNIMTDSQPYVYCPFLDPNETDPAHKYKAACGSIKGHGTTTALAHSPDGLRWTYYNEGRPITGRAADCINEVLWDPEAKVYRLYTRTDYQRTLGADLEVRGTRDMINPDVRADPNNWTMVREWVLDREPEDWKRRQMYSFNGWIYENIQFGLIWSLEYPDDYSEGPSDLYRRHERNIMNFFLVTARGNDMWDLDWVYAEKPFIPRGPAGSFDCDAVQPAINIVTWNDKHWIYYVGSPERHARGAGGVGLATLPLDRFVCLEAKGQPGVVVTKPFKFEGDKLEINIDAGTGEVLVEILDASGKPIEGFGEKDADPCIEVDGLRVWPSWKGDQDLGRLKGQIVSLRFHLKNARLYAFQVTSQL